MPAKIDIKLVYQAIIDKMAKDGRSDFKLYYQDFVRLVKGASIASSKNAIETLWYQLLDSEVNLNKGYLDIVIVSRATLETVLNPSAHTHSYTHTLSHTEVA